MKNKFLLILAGLVVVVYSMLYGKALPGLRPSVSGIVYDRSIKAEYGRPILVAEAVDGDTVTLINGERLRYIGIDTPEEFDERKPVQCFAREAAAKNKALVEGKAITFYKDVNTKDRYGRWLGYVYLADGTFVNLELVRQGYGFSYRYPPDVSKTEEFREAEQYARSNGLGLWGGRCSVETLKSGRKQTNPAE